MIRGNGEDQIYYVYRNRRYCSRVSEGSGDGTRDDRRGVERGIAFGNLGLMSKINARGIDNGPSRNACRGRIRNGANRRNSAGKLRRKHTDCGCA